MKISARNLFKGIIKTIHLGAVNDEVELSLNDTLTITAIITHQSRQRLQLKEGDKAFALIKSSFVILATDMDNIQLSTRNCLTGLVGKIVSGEVNSEVTLNLVGDRFIVAVITNDSCRDMGLKPGSKATAIFKASSVILGVENQG